MATRSTIALEYDDGTVGQIYCHYDGYIENNGQILKQFYITSSDVSKLLSRGDMSSLGKDVHSSDFYADRGEDGTEQRKFKSISDYMKNFQDEEFNYIFRRDGKWYVNHYDTKDSFVEL